LNTEELRNILDEFLTRWKIENLNKITLNEYVGLRNKDTFCQWVETRTRILGSMKGLPGSIKFGIYERNDKLKKPKGYDNDSEFSWLKAYNCRSRKAAFGRVKNDVLQTIEYSQNGNFESIDNLLLPDLFKWKIAFLYSNERLIPIYKRTVLLRIAKHFGLQVNGKIKVSMIQSLMMKNKPPYLSVYEYMDQLYKRFGEKNDIGIAKKRKRRNRKSVQSRDIKSQLRTQSNSYIADQKHNKLQEQLKKILISKYGRKNVLLEENYVDVKLLQPNYITFYEIKSNSYASDCIRDALGQILFYSFYDKDPRTKKLVVVGQYPLIDDEKKFLQHLQSKNKIQIDYIDIKLD
jgi:hypothetical protein